VLDAHSEAFFSGIAIGVVLTLGAAVIFLGATGILRALR
jgi:hypothetical protein